MDYTFKEVMDAYVKICNYGNSTNDLNWCGGRCPLYKKYGDECSSFLTIGEERANEWARIVMEESNGL